MLIDFSKHSNEIFNPLFHKLQKSQSRYVINYGGAGSGKSFTQTQHEIILALQAKETTLITRKFASTLKHSVIALTRRILSDWGITELYTENKSDQVFTFTHNGSQLIFKGLDDTEKIKSIAGITRIWMEEMNEFSQDDFNQLNLRLRGRERLQLTGTFNPIDENHWIKRTFFDSRQYDAQTTIIQTTYKDNRFIDQAYREELERYQIIDPNYHRIYARGEWGFIDDARIFKTWPFAEFPDKAKVVYGLDFGYSQDPTAVLRTAVVDGDIYLDEIIYQAGLTNADIASLIKQYGYHGEPVVCDSAEPKSIQDLKNYGIKALAADKGKGSVNAGIDYLKRNNVFISPRSRNLERENLHYKWKKDRMGNFLPVPEAAHDHCFAEDTMILTPKGNKKISELRAGEVIINSFGYDKILWSGITKHAEIYEFTIYFINFIIRIKCTGDHLFYTDKGWKQIQLIRKGDRVFLSRHLMDSVLDYTQKKDIIQEADVGCTYMFGNIITGKFQMVTRFIIRMKIHIITLLRTLKYCQKTYTNQNTENKELKTTRNGSKIFTQTESQKHPNGIKAKKVLSGISNMQKNSNLEHSHLELGNAMCAETYSLPKQTHKDFVQMRANQNTEGIKDMMISRQNVNSAVKNFHTPNIKKLDFVHIHVVEKIEKSQIEAQNVYNLEIEKHPEYIANGMLVHNCADAARYAFSLGLHERTAYNLEGVFF